MTMVSCSSGIQNFQDQFTFTFFLAKSIQLTALVITCTYRHVLDLTFYALLCSILKIYKTVFLSIYVYMILPKYTTIYILTGMWLLFHVFKSTFGLTLSGYIVCGILHLPVYSYWLYDRSLQTASSVLPSAVLFRDHSPRSVSSTELSPLWPSLAVTQHAIVFFQTKNKLRISTHKKIPSRCGRYIYNAFNETDQQNFTRQRWYTFLHVLLIVPVHIKQLKYRSISFLKYLLQ